MTKGFILDLSKWSFVKMVQLKNYPIKNINKDRNLYGGPFSSLNNRTISERKKRGTYSATARSKVVR